MRALSWTAVLEAVSLAFFEARPRWRRVAILRRALEEPLRTLAQNGGQDGAVVVAAVRRMQAEQHNPKRGYNGLEDRYEDLEAAGIIDATKVTRSAIQNAASIAAMMLTTEALITDIPEKDHVSAPAMPE